MKFEHSVLAVDLSKSSDDLVHSLKDLKKLGIQKITLVTAVSNPYPGGPEKFDTSSFKEKLKYYASKITDQGFDADWELKVEAGIFAPVTILKTAKELKADLLILGHRGHNKFSELFLGSVANEVLHRANLPLLLLRVSDNPGAENVSIYRDLTTNILVATDFSKNADKTLRLFENDSLNNSNVTLVNVRTRTENQNAGVQLQERAQKLRSDGVKNVSTEILNGNTAFEINKFADSNDIGMIVMGSQGKGFIEELFIGSNSMRTARFTKKPLLLIPARS